MGFPNRHKISQWFPVLWLQNRLHTVYLCDLCILGLSNSPALSLIVLQFPGTRAHPQGEKWQGETGELGCLTPFFFCLTCHLGIGRFLLRSIFWDLQMILPKGTCPRRSWLVIQREVLLGLLSQAKNRAQVDIWFRETFADKEMRPESGLRRPSNCEPWEILKLWQVGGWTWPQEKKALPLETFLCKCKVCCSGVSGVVRFFGFFMDFVKGQVDSTSLFLPFLKITWGCCFWRESYAVTLRPAGTSPRTPPWNCRKLWVLWRFKAWFRSFQTTIFQHFGGISSIFQTFLCHFPPLSTPWQSTLPQVEGTLRNSCCHCNNSLSVCSLKTGSCRDWLMILLTICDLWDIWLYNDIIYYIYLYYIIILYDYNCYDITDTLQIHTWLS